MKMDQGRPMVAARLAGGYMAVLVALCVIDGCSSFASFGGRYSSSFLPPKKQIAVSTTLLQSSAIPEQSPVVSDAANNNARDYNEVYVAKTGGRGSVSASDTAADQQLSLGAPPPRRPEGGHFLTRGGVQVTANVQPLEYSRDKRKEGSSEAEVESLVNRLDAERGVLLSSSYEFPGRYARWSMGFVNPPLEVSSRGSHCTIRALNDRGKVLLPAVIKAMEALREEHVLESVSVKVGTSGGTGDERESAPAQVDVVIVPPPPVGTFSEEERSKQPSLFSVVRSLVDLFGYEGGDGQLGLYGAFGYDLTFQFEPINIKQDRDPEQRDVLLYLPDEVVVVDKNRQDAWKISYEFCYEGVSTQGLPRDGKKEPFQHFDEAAQGASFQSRDTPKSEFATSVERAKREFAVGNLFEAVLSQTFREKLDEKTRPSVLFKRLRARNPAPYGFFINLGEDEYLVGASPEMFVRCEKTADTDYGTDAMRVETCPISGTVARGADALEDAARIKSLMMNAKEESELTMCTDVDRNDKSRICEPGSVKVIGRRQIEMYSRLIHTVDHVEGYLRPEFDALDAFLCHTWAVTVTGAPKTWAIQFVEDNERSPRCWYGGAIGLVGFDGSLNTGLTLRTVRVKNGVAEVRAGATLLYDSSPPAEELETELKASAMIDAIVQSGDDMEADDDSDNESRKLVEKSRVGSGKSVVLIDHEDSFVHTLGNYLRQTGADVSTLRSGPSALKALESMVREGRKPDMVVLSPGPGNPSDFGLSDSIALLTRLRIPVFGVCLGLQGMVEHFGGTLGVLSYPMHGKQSQVTLTAAGKRKESIFAGLPDTFDVARYHSLHGIKERLPSCLEVTAQSEDGIVMGIQHKTLPLAAVQFHPESILTSPAHGMTILMNGLTNLCSENEEADPVAPQTGSEIVGALEGFSASELKEKLRSVGLSTGGTKSELVVRLALWTHKSSAIKGGRITLEDMTLVELKELKQSLGLKMSSTKKEDIVAALAESLEDSF